MSSEPFVKDSGLEEKEVLIEVGGKADEAPTPSVFFIPGLE